MTTLAELIEAAVAQGKASESTCYSWQTLALSFATIISNRAPWSARAARIHWI